MELVGWIGAFLFAFCGAPQAWQSYKQGHSKGISLPFLGMWLGGELCTIAYVIGKHGFDAPLMLNYFANIIFILVILKYKYMPRQ